MIELERLAVIFPRADMDERKWRVLFETYLEDLKHFTIEEIRFGCRRYRTAPDAKWFPTPGQLVAACRNPYADKPKTKSDDPIEDIDEGTPRSQEQIADLLSRTRVKYNYYPVSRGQDDAKTQKTTVIMTPELIERERSLAKERSAALARRLERGNF